MPSFRKPKSKPASSESRSNLIPYLKSASSKLNLASSTNSLSSLLLASSHSSKSLISGFRDFIHGKENDASTSRRPEISGPTLTPEALEAVRERFKLVPLATAATNEELAKGPEYFEGFKTHQRVSMKRAVSPPIVHLPKVSPAKGFSRSVLDKI